MTAHWGRRARTTCGHPSDDGEVSLRVVTEGQLERLEIAFARHQGVEPRLLPCSFQRYRLGAERGREQIPASALDGSWIVFRATSHHGGRHARLRLTRCVDLGRALRGAVLRHAAEPVPEVLSGHGADGRPIERPHVAFVSLADVYRPNPNQAEGRDRSNKEDGQWSKPRRRVTASGAVLGVAMLLPHGLDDTERRSVLKAVADWEQAEQGRCRLVMGRIGELDIDRVTGGDPRRTLQPGWWIAASRRWATVTPIALDRNPGDLLNADEQAAQEAAAKAEQIIARACEDIGLPSPAWGADHAALRPRRGAQRQGVHAVPAQAGGAAARVCARRAALRRAGARSR